MLAHEPGLTRLGTAIFLLSGAALLFQFAQTRLFSAALDYHLTFLVISDALLGVAAAGTANALVDDSSHRPASWQLALAAGASALLALIGETRVDPARHHVVTAVVVAYALGALPVFFASWVIVRALRQRPRASGPLYAADLAGAAAGSLLGYLAIRQLGAQGLFGAAAALPVLAAALLAPQTGRAAAWRVAAPVVTAALVVSLSLWGEALAAPRPNAHKAAVVVLAEGARREASYWDPLARIDALVHDGTTYYGVLLNFRYRFWRPPATLLLLDLDATTPVLDVGRVADLEPFDSSLLAAPYELGERRRVLVVGPGGGVDVLVALRRGATDVTGVEVNRTVVELMRTRYAAYSGHLYAHPAVRIVEDEARSFVRRSAERYDAIVMTIVDSWAALTSGAYALTESYLYTEEAFADYVRHLSPDGVVAIGRWYREPPLEMLRAAEVAASGLRRVGVARPESHIAVLRHEGFGMLLVAARSLEEAQMARLRAYAADQGFALAYDPLRPAPPFSRALVEAARDRAPATDDRPFFFDSLPLSGGLVLDALAGRAAFPRGYLTLHVAFVTAAVLSYFVVLLPLRRRLAPALTRPPFMAGAAYGIAFGFGFIFAEIVALQRLTLYLGQPSLAFSVGLAALLGGAACGSALVRRWPGGLRLVSLACALALFVALAVFPALNDATLAWPLAWRAVLGLLATAFVGLPMGAALPRVVAAVGSHHGAVSWLWAVNGSASVIGSVIAVAIALTWGFAGLGALAATCYALAALLPGERVLGVVPSFGERGMVAARTRASPPPTF